MQNLLVRLLPVVLLPALLWSSGGSAPIFFSFRPIPFKLENSETPTRYAPETMAGGVGVFDYDDDGDLDIFFTNGGDMPQLVKRSPAHWNRLFANDGRGNWTDETEKSGLAGSGYDTGAAIGDYDNDGCKDLFVAGIHRNTLYHNNGDGTFSDVTRQAGLANPDPEYGPLWAVGGAWFDFDADGHLDLFVVNYLSWSPAKEPTCAANGRRDYCHPKLYGGLPNRLYRNRGNGTFEDVSEASGIRAHVGKGMGAAVADLDLDGRLDIFVTNDKLLNFLFHNRGNGRFAEIALRAMVALPEQAQEVSGMGVDFRDVDNDELPDITFAALENETFPLFRNMGQGMFEDVTLASGLAQASLRMAGYSPAIFDFDNDGWKDLFVSRGHVQSLDLVGLQVEQHNSVFRNLGNGKFGALTEEAGFGAGPRRRHRGSAHGDFNGDGRIDIVVTALGAEAEIWLNDSPRGNNWLELQLEGTRSNRDGIGARIKVVTQRGTQYNHASTSVGYASSSAGPVHFGLGPHQAADLVEISWPSGKVQRIAQVKAGQILKVKEPED